MERKKEIFKIFMLGIFAGIAIGLGSLIYVVCTFNGHTLLGSFFFGIGLFLVCLFSLFLYTGKIGFILDADNKKRYALDLIVGIIGNLIGAIGFGYLMFLFLKDGEIFKTALTVANKRMTDLGSGQTPFYISMIGSFFCGALVYLAVYCYKKDFSMWLKTLIIFLCVFAFVACGFEHCIANAFYVSLANKWCLETLINLIICIVFNSLGSLILALGIKLVLNKKN